MIDFTNRLFTNMNHSSGRLVLWMNSYCILSDFSQYGAGIGLVMAAPNRGRSSLQIRVATFVTALISTLLCQFRRSFPAQPTCRCYQGTLGRLGTWFCCNPGLFAIGWSVIDVQWALVW